MHVVFLGLGANLGDRLAALRAARAALAPQVLVGGCSSVYQTPPWGVADQPPFLNAVCRGQTALAPAELLALLKALEQQLGRQPSFRWGPRAIDLDILLYDQLVLDQPQLQLPHPRLHERAFVLVPLLELAPNLPHPLLNKPMRELAEALSTAEIERISGDDW